MKKRFKLIPLYLAAVIICVSIAVVAILFITMNNIGIPDTKVELRIEWSITEGKYLPINVSAGDILYGKRGEVQVRIEEVKEGEEQKHYIIKHAKGDVIKGEEKVEEGMKLYLTENPEEMVTIPEASVPSIEIVKINRSFKYDVLDVNRDLNCVLVKVGEEEMMKMMERMDVRYVERNKLVDALYVPNDPLYEEQ